MAGAHLSVGQLGYAVWRTLIARKLVAAVRLSRLGLVSGAFVTQINVLHGFIATSFAYDLCTSFDYVN